MGGSTSTKLYRWQQQQSMEKAIKYASSPVKRSIDNHRRAYQRSKTLLGNRFRTNQVLQARKLKAENSRLVRKLRQTPCSKAIKRSNLPRAQWSYEDSLHDQVKSYHVKNRQQNSYDRARRIEMQNQHILYRIENARTSKKWDDKEFARHQRLSRQMQRRKTRKKLPPLSRKRTIRPRNKFPDTLFPYGPVRDTKLNPLCWRIS